MTANQPLNDAIIIGIDFGTTFSGVAWAYSREPEEIEIVTSWDAELNHCSDVEKAPTQLYYDGNNKDVKWGYSIPSDKEALKWFKLLLLDPKDLPADVARSSQLQEARRLRNKVKKEPIELIVRHSRWAPCWYLAKRSTIQTGDTIVVCDAGGGTVDLISYVFESTDPFVVKECVKGDGDLCGGVFLDEGFIKLVKKKSPAGTWGSVSNSDEKKFLNDQWEHGIKPQFENQKKSWPVDLPDSCGSNSSVGLRRRITLALTSDEILSVFSPIARKIETLVAHQVDTIRKKYHQEPKYIILVGGFGRSRYLFNSLEKRFKSTILQSRGNKPWTAICRGAVVQGLIHRDPTSGLGMNVEARIARMSYGVLYWTPFVHGKHDLRDKVWDAQEQKFKATNQMEWFLKEGDDISEKRSVHHDYYRLVSGSVTDVDATIQCSTVFPPPSRYDSSSVRSLCNIKWSKRVNAKKLPRYQNPLGAVFSRLDFRVKMDCEDGTVDFTIFHNGSRVGSHNVDVQFN
ncbi:hypothetical protein FGRMN_1128 [Fusarium graminum]|nr:hypothetical protein FGRMN_1128 [Fusarium graminum]